MDTLREIGTGMLSNVIWVVAAFALIFVRDRRKRLQIDRCLRAYLLYLLRSTALVRNSVYPYMYLVRLRSTEGTILPTLLESLQDLAGRILSQTQQMLVLVPNGRVQESILGLYEEVIQFQTMVSESRIAAHVIVGNPVELVEPPRGGQEIESYRRFAVAYVAAVRSILDAAPAAVRAALPAGALTVLDQRTPLEGTFSAPQ